MISMTKSVVTGIVGCLIPRIFPILLVHVAIIAYDMGSFGVSGTRSAQT
jgi:hypothetical protein